MDKLPLNAIILLFLCVILVRCDGGSYCYMEDVDPYKQFGTKTSYDIARAPNMEILPPDVCKPIYIWALIRHGARYSSKVTLEESDELQRQILSNHETDKRGTLCFKDLQNLRQWTIQGHGKSSNDLASQGILELSGLAVRLAANFRNLLANNTDGVHFQATLKRRSRESAAAFIESMYGGGQASNVNISTNEDVLHFLELSEEHHYEVTDNNETYREKELFLKTELMQSLIKEVSHRLGYSESLPEKTIGHLYHSCAFENAWNPNSRPGFCAAFTREHLQMLEYFYFDLPDYYKFGYGSTYNVKIRSPVVEDLLLKLEMVTKSKNEGHQEAPRAHFYFSHSPNLTHAITKLGLYRDKSPLLHSNYGRKKDWSMHTISPFNGNLIAVLYECDEKPAGLKKFEIALYHNEMLIHIPGCPTGLCPLSRFSDLVRLSNVGTSNAEDSSVGTSNTHGFAAITEQSLSEPCDDS